MAIKNVVKVMNFHSLLRVDKARRKTEMYFQTQMELENLIRKVIYNKNLIHDKTIIIPNENGKILNIYIGNDLGFCGDFNQQINKAVKNDQNDRIIIGKKVSYNKEDKGVILYQDKDEFFEDFTKLENIIYEVVLARTYKEINVIYNQYNNINSFEFKTKKIYPINFEENKDEDYDEDFTAETEVNSLLSNFLALYICYEIKIREMNSYAAENVVRQQITHESLKKIDEIEEANQKIERKKKNKKNFQKLIDNYRKV